MNAGALFSTLDLGKRSMRNRVVQGPLSTGYAEPSGHVSPKTIGHYARRAAGGVGMVIVENYAVSWSGRQMPRQGMISGREFLPGLRELANAIRHEGALAVIQLVHSGRYAGPWDQYEAQRRLAPSAIPFDLLPDRNVTPQEITRGEIAETIDAFAHATLLAREAGFDGVEIHGGQGFLISSFQSPRMNARSDEYGGDGRSRFAREVIAAVAAEAGDMLVGYHLFSDEFVDGGWTTADAARFVSGIGDLSVDFFVPIPTTFESMRPLLMAGGPDPRNHDPAVLRLLKANTVAPVFANGGLGDPLTAAAALADGADAVVLARPLLTDPDWTRKVQEGRVSELIGCHCAPPTCAQTQMAGVICHAWPEGIRARGAWISNERLAGAQGAQRD